MLQKGEDTYGNPLALCPGGISCHMIRRMLSQRDNTAKVIIIFSLLLTNNQVPSHGSYKRTSKSNQR